MISKVEKEKIRLFFLGGAKNKKITVEVVRLRSVGLGIKSGRKGEGRESGTVPSPCLL